MASRICIVGAGHAGGLVAAQLAKRAPAARITLVGAEPHLPYQRPPLSKAYLAGDLARERLYLRPPAFYEKAGIALILGVAARAIDRSAKTVRLDDGRDLGYDKLALATGGAARRLAVPGADLPGVHYLRDIADADALRRRLCQGARLVVIGGGYVGLEVAAMARKLGLEVTLVELAGRLLARVAPPVISDFLARLHREEGVAVYLGAMVSALEGKGRVTAVALDDGRHLPADLVVVGVGLSPNTALAEAAGLACEDGILVDEYAVTSDPAIVALGDCANAFNLFLGRRARLESVQNATDMAPVAAASLAGAPQPLAAVPWFWSEQYDVKLQSVGLAQGFDQMVLRGDPFKGRGFAAFYLKEGRVIAADCVNRMQAFMAAKRLAGEGRPVDAACLGDDAFDLKQLF